MDKLPTFPTIDLAAPINWMLDGFTGMLTSNATLLIGAGIIMALVPVAFKKIKSATVSSVK